MGYIFLCTRIYLYIVDLYRKGLYMINLAVIELKDIVKYLIRITLVIAIVVFLTKFFASFKTNLNIEKNSFLSCLDTVVPSIKAVNKKEESISAGSKVEPLKLALGIELGVIESTEPNSEATAVEVTESSENTSGENEEELQEAETGVKTEVVETNVPEKYTSEYNGVKIRNETDNIKLTEEMLTPDVSVNTKNILI